MATPRETEGVPESPLFLSQEQHQSDRGGKVTGDVHSGGVILIEWVLQCI